MEDIIFSETGVTRTVDAMGRVGIAIRGADARHTLMLIDGQPVMGSESKFMGNSDEAMRIGVENIDHIEIIRGAATAKYGPDAVGGVINIHTKKISDTPSFQLNAEARYHNHEGSDAENNTWPSNWYMRADSGKVGNAKFSVWGSKRDILPVYSAERAYTKDASADGTGYYEDFRPSLRYYGTSKSIGASGEVDINDNNKISFRVMSEKEDMERRNKNETNGIGSYFEPIQVFGRTMKRDTYGLSYTGKNAKSDWKIDVNYGKMKESDTTKTTYFGSGFSDYTGKNSLASVDWLEHKQLDVNATMNTAINDQHLLSYGMGYTEERAEGTRLKQAPKTWVKGINPWDYDKNLWVNTANGAVNEPDSSVHNYLFKQTEEGGLIWNKNQEYYGIENLPTDSFVSKEEASKASGLDNADSSTLTDAEKDLVSRYNKFGDVLKAENQDLIDKGTLPSYYPASYFVDWYYSLSGVKDYDGTVKWNGVHYMEEFDKRKNQVTGGEAKIQRRHFFIQDTWQVNDNTILTPIIRLDHSDLFGGEVTANLGMTHSLNGNPHRRLKANIGTGYTEPGMGELYYNWEMYGSAGGNRYGWYWIGNPNLKPEKSFNMDISLEGENNKTYSRVSLFHNQIDNYMTSYFTGQLLDFNHFGATSVTNADRIYSFKNIGKAEITGFEAEVQQRFNDKWSAKLGYAWLHAINKSDPDMPRQLLDRPQHKVDISLNYEDKDNGWRAALWGDYYIHMLDSNSIDTTFTKDDIDANGNWKKKDAKYQKKTFGIWNFMVQKDFGKDVTAYVGVDNLFNHRDDDRAYQDRLYRIGANIKFGDDADTAKEAASKAEHASSAAEGTANSAVTAIGNGTGEGVATAKNETGDWFLTKPSDKDAGRKAGDVDLIGDYRVRSNMFNGKEAVGVRELVMFDTQTDKYQLITGSNDDGAVKNFRNKPGHALEQRLRLGLDAQLGENTNVVVEASTGEMDTKYSIADKRGLHDVRLERAELNQKANKWDFTMGRLTEKMGVTGYWFGKEYVGLRTTWTDKNTQVRVGYGDFSDSTGITDSAYTHAEYGFYYRTPTYDELMGYTDSGNPSKHLTTYPAGVDPNDPNAPLNFYGKYQSANGLMTYDETTKKWTAKEGVTDMQIADARLQVLTQLNDIRKNLGTYNDANTNNKGRKWYNDIYLQSTKEYVEGLNNPYMGNSTKVDDTKAEYGQDTAIANMVNTALQYSLYGQITDKNGNIVEVQRYSSTGRPVGKPVSNVQLFANVNGTLTIPKSRYYLTDEVFHDLGDTALSFKKYNGGELADTYASNSVTKLQHLGYTIDSISWNDLYSANGKEKLYTMLGQVYDAIEENFTKHGDSIVFKKPDGTAYANKKDVLDALYVYMMTANRGTKGVMESFGLTMAGTNTSSSYHPTDGAPVPLNGLAALIPTTGRLVKQDQIPAIERAAYIQVRQKVGDNLGLTAWYLRSMGDGYHKTGMYGEGTDLSKWATYDQELDIANVFGLGAQYRLGKSTLSFDWGVNRSETGRFFHGARDEFGRYTGGGSNPTFWVLRADIGKSDTDVPGSWNAFADYKYFAHGSFFGGNGTEALPDRYLDGIRSFTLGAGYVPAKNFLLEAFYTFGAQSTQKRDTLYGSEDFSLGDYTRVQVSYKF